MPNRPLTRAIAIGPHAPSVRARINDFRATPDKPFVLGLPTGSSPIPTYKHLIRLVKDGKLSCVVTVCVRVRVPDAGRQ